MRHNSRLRPPFFSVSQGGGMPFACRSGVIAARLGLKYNRAKESNEKTPRQAAKRLSIATAHEPHLTERRSRRVFTRPFHDVSRLCSHGPHLAERRSRRVSPRPFHAEKRTAHPSNNPMRSPFSISLCVIFSSKSPLPAARSQSSAAASARTLRRCRSRRVSPTQCGSASPARAARPRAPTRACPR